MPLQSSEDVFCEYLETVDHLPYKSLVLEAGQSLGKAGGWNKEGRTSWSDTEEVFNTHDSVHVITK